MSLQSSKGYVLEAQTRDWLISMGYPVTRPRTTSHTAADIGDIDGLPLVISCKNHRAMALGTWVAEMEQTVWRGDHKSGVVVHKRHRYGAIADQYVTTTLGLLLPLIDAYSEIADGAIACRTIE